MITSRAPGVAGDIDPYLTALLRRLQVGWIPPARLSKDEWLEAREGYKSASGADDWYIGFTGFASPKMFAYYDERTYGTYRRNLLRVKERLARVDVYCTDYRELVIPSNSLIFCDPPRPYHSRPTPLPAVWQWCQEKGEEGHSVFFITVGFDGRRGFRRIHTFPSGLNDHFEALELWMVNK